VPVGFERPTSLASLGNRDTGSMRSPVWRKNGTAERVHVADLGNRAAGNRPDAARNQAARGLPGGGAVAVQAVARQPSRGRRVSPPINGAVGLEAAACEPSNRRSGGYPDSSVGRLQADGEDWPAARTRRRSWDAGTRKTGSG
jgi:hypothetical protein